MPTGPSSARRGPSLVKLAQLVAPAPTILVSLAGGPKHGYAIMEEVAVLTGVVLGPGTVYGALERLERIGLIEALPEENRRLPYRLSKIGRIALRLHLTAMKRFAETGLARLAKEP